MKKIILFLLSFTIVFSLVACSAPEPEEPELCEKCKKNEATQSVTGIMFSDNKIHKLCKTCWDKYCDDNNVIDGNKGYGAQGAFGG